MLRKKSPEMVLDRASAEERDSRTVLAMQLSQATKEKDLKEFFSTVGDVKAVKLIQSLSKKRQKNIGIAYIEFKESLHFMLQRKLQIRDSEIVVTRNSCLKQLLPDNCQK